MKLKELKKSTLYQSSDLDDMTIMIAVCRNGKTQYEPLCFMGWQPLPDHPEGGFVVLGGLTEIQRLVESGKIEAPEGYIPPDQSKLGYDDEDTSA
jgi:hypothetical protein